MGDFSLPVKGSGDTLNIHSGYNLYNNLLENAVNQHVKKTTREHDILDLVFTTKKV